MDTVFNTSFTTAMAFVATGMSPLMPISTFGWYAATCIVVNYLFCITLMPPVVVIGEMYCSKPLCTFFPSSTEKPEQQACSAPNQAVQKQHEAIPTSEDVDSGEGLQMVATGESDGVALGMEEGEGGVDGPVSTGAVLVEEEREVVVGGKFVEMYIDSMGFSLKNSGPLTGIPLVAVVIAVSLFVFGVVGVVYGVSLEPPTSQEAWYPSRHMFTMAQKSMANDFLGFDDNSYADLKLTFGISKIDRSGFDIYKPGENRGTAIFDDDYNLATPACQRVMTRMCADLVEYSCTASSCSPTYKLVRSNQTECFMEPFQTYMQTNYGVDPVNLTEAEFYSNLTQFRTTELQTYEAESWQNLIGFIDGTLKFASVTSMLTMENEEPMQNKFRVEGVLNDFVAKVKGYEECASNACDCSSLKFSSSYVFSWMRSEMGLVSGFYNGLAFAMPVAACVLLFATGNILISLYAVGSVFFIVFGVLGFANYALGWSLGTAESIAGIIIIGFSVDYTVHLGHMYTVGEYHDLYGRVDKFKFASRKIAATIVGGAITTAGAGVFMFACQLGFFFKMATLIVATILLSYLYSLGFFMAVLYLFGPEGTTGDIYVMGRYVYAVVSGSDKSTLQEIQPAKVEQFDSH